MEGVVEGWAQCAGGELAEERCHCGGVLGGGVSGYCVVFVEINALVTYRTV